MAKTKLTAAEKQRRYREKRKLDPAREDAYKEKHKARNAKRKTVNLMTSREHRAEKKKWRKWKESSRKKQQSEVENREPSPTPLLLSEPAYSSSGNSRRGRKVTLRFKSKCVRENKTLKKQISELEQIVVNEKRKVEKYKKRIQRLAEKDKKKLGMTPENELTPNSKTKKMINDLHDDIKNSGDKRRKAILLKSNVARALKFHNAMVLSIKDKLGKSKSRTEKQHIKSALSSKLIQRYQLRKALARKIGFRASQRLLQRQQRENTTRFAVESFFLSDDVSRATAGIKETVTRKKIKKQKQYLLSPMKTLYKKFSRLHGNTISYTTFTRYRPFYVLKPSDVTRDTCLCRQHTNLQLKATKLKQLNLITDKDPHNLYLNIVCDKTKPKCMYNLCRNCNTKEAPIEPYNKDEEIKWEKWVIKTEMRAKKVESERVQVPVKITTKDTISGTLGDLVLEFQTEMKQLKKHAFNIKMQNKAYDYIKNNMKETEAVVHADFSENFACKFSQEIQSFHFGGSRNQVTLHTGILYISEKDPLPFSSVSPCRDHGPPAIWAHLKPILEYIRTNYQQITTVHFFSDGPSSQYKQKNNFYLFSTLVFDLGFTCSTWSFFESAHGKGAPYGVGGALKRLANYHVNHGCDIPDAESFFKVFEENSKIKLFYVTNDNIKAMTDKLPNIPLTTIAGTRGIHQIVTTKREQILYRPISCFCILNEWHNEKLCDCFFPYKSLSFKDQFESAKNKEKSLCRKNSRYYAIYSSDSDSDQSDVGNDVNNEAAVRNVVLDTPTRDTVKEGAFIIVELQGGTRKKTKHRYAGIITRVSPGDGDYVVMFLQQHGIEGNSFTANERDESIIDFDQIKFILPEPNLIAKGLREVYKFSFNLAKEL